MDQDIPSAATNDIWDEPTVTRIQPTRPGGNARGRTAAIRALQQGELMLYAMRVKGGYIKIGCTSDLEQRRDHLRGEILAFAFGDFADETEIHKSLAEFVHHGREWYNPTPAVLSVVNDMRAEFNLAPLAA